MKFATEWENRISTVTPSGTEIIKEYGRKIDPQTGEYILYVKNTRNLYNEIQEAGIGMSIQEQITKFENGEIPQFQNKNHSFNDITKIPNNYIERNKLIKENLKKIETLNLEINKEIEKETKKDEKNEVHT